METENLDQKISKINSDIDLAHECSKKAENVADVLKKITVNEKEEK